MKEYIERAMAFAVLVDFPGELSPENIGLAVARKAIDALPATDVAEVRHGRWEKVSIASGIISRVRCSVCARTQPLTFENMPYCPTCGARMDKEDEQ